MDRSKFPNRHPERSGMVLRAELADRRSPHYATSDFIALLAGGSRVRAGMTLEPCVLVDLLFQSKLEPFQESL